MELLSFGNDFPKDSKVMAFGWGTTCGVAEVVAEVAAEVASPTSCTIQHSSNIEDNEY
jgi:hypothetical protein